MVAQITARTAPELVSRALASLGRSHVPRDGHELFYLEPAGALMRVSVGNERIGAASAPMKLVDGGYFVGSGSVGGNPFRNYDVSADAASASS